MGGEAIASIIAALATAVLGFAFKAYRDRRIEAQAKRAEALENEKRAEKARGDLLDVIRRGGTIELRSEGWAITLPDETPPGSGGQDS